MRRWVCLLVRTALPDTWVTPHTGDMGYTLPHLGEKMAGLCREIGISRKTGYKISNRYKDSGVEGLVDRPRPPIRHTNQLPFEVERQILVLKRSYPPGMPPRSAISRSGRMTYSFYTSLRIIALRRSDNLGVKEQIRC